MRLTTTALAAILIAAAGQAQEFNITRPEVDYAHDVDFAAFSTYGWKPSQDPGDDPAAHATLVFEIDRALEEQGLSKAQTAEDAQLLVRYYTRFERRLRSTATQERAIEPSNQRTSVGFSRGLDAELVIELYRAGDDRRLWRGSTKENTSQKHFSDEQIRRAVRLILSEFPPEPEGGEMGPKR